MKVHTAIRLLAVLALCGLGICQGGEKGEMPSAEELEQQIKVRRLQRQMEAEEAEFKFDQAMRGLELEKRQIEVENMRKGAMWKNGRDDGGKGVFLLVIIVVHVLLAIWVYRDIKERGKGSGIWVAIVLLAGILGAIPYAIVRLGDMR